MRLTGNMRQMIRKARSSQSVVYSSSSGPEPNQASSMDSGLQSSPAIVTLTSAVSKFKPGVQEAGSLKQSRAQSPRNGIQDTAQTNYLSQKKHRVELDSDDESLADLVDEPDARPFSELEQLNSLHKKQQKSKLCKLEAKGFSGNCTGKIEDKAETALSQRLEAAKKRT